MTKRSHVVSLAVILAAAALAMTAAFAANASKRNSVYAVDDVTVVGVTRADGDKVQIQFITLAETLYFCPGVNATEKDGGIELRFVRCSTNRKCKVDHSAKDGTVTIPAGKKHIFVADSDKKVTIWPKD